MEQYWQELQQQVHRKAALERKQEALCEQRRKSVSYTHLTLPTILRV